MLIQVYIVVLKPYRNLEVHQGFFFFFLRNYILCLSSEANSCRSQVKIRDRWTLTLFFDMIQLIEFVLNSPRTEKRIWKIAEQKSYILENLMKLEA